MDLKSFCVELIKQKKLTTLDEQTLDGMAGEMTERLSEQINKAILAKFSDQEYQEFEELLKTDPTAEQVQTFVANSSVDIKQVTLATMMIFKEFYLGR